MFAVVDIGDAIGQCDQRQQPPGYFGDRPTLDRLRILHVHEFLPNAALVPRLLVADRWTFLPRSARRAATSSRSVPSARTPADQIVLLPRWRAQAVPGVAHLMV